MSIVVQCDTGGLSLDDIFRLVSGIDVDGNIYIRLVSGNAPSYIYDIACDNFGVSALDILRGALVLNDDGEYALNTTGGSGSTPEPAYCATYQTIYDSFTTPPSDAIAAEQNTMVCGLVDDGVWAKLDVFYLFAQTTNGDGEALKNWVNPGTFDATAFNAPTFVALEGFTGNGSTNYIDLNWNPNTNGVNYALDHASFGCYVRTNVDGLQADMGAISGDGANRAYVISRSATNVTYASINESTFTSVASLDSSGMWIINRLDSTDSDTYRNKVRIDDSSNASSALSSDNICVLCRNVAGTPEYYSTRQVSMAYLGAGFTQTDVNNMTDRFETYMVSNGKGVIP